jgi:hypothetical protein
MKETGLILKAPMVRAILEGRKTQTRRVAKEFVGRKDLDSILRKFPKQRGGQYGEPGDRIYVRETWQKAGGGYGIWYAATDSKADDGNSPVTSWRPSSQMPKELARIWLEVTGVRVERLQDISEADALAEGARFELASIDSVRIGATASFLSGFRNIWESTGGDWDANPWVWVIDFKVLSTTGRPT